MYIVYVENSCRMIDYMYSQCIFCFSLLKTTSKCVANVRQSEVTNAIKVLELRGRALHCVLVGMTHVLVLANLT